MEIVVWLHNTVNVVPATELYIFKNDSTQAVQWLILRAPTVEGTGPVSAQGTKFLHMPCGVAKIETKLNRLKMKIVKTTILKSIYFYFNESEKKSGLDIECHQMPFGVY